MTRALCLILALSACAPEPTCRHVWKHRDVESGENVTYSENPKLKVCK